MGPRDAGAPSPLALWEAYRPLALRTARRKAARAGMGRALEDLEQEALLGLWRAAVRYDPGRGRPFAAVAVRCVRGALCTAAWDNDYRGRKAAWAQWYGCAYAAALPARAPMPPSVGDARQADPAARAADRDLAECLLAGVARAAYRRVLRWHYWDGLKAADVARRLGLGPEAAVRLLGNARAALRAVAAARGERDAA